MKLIWIMQAANAQEAPATTAQHAAIDLTFGAWHCSNRTKSKCRHSFKAMLQNCRNSSTMVDTCMLHLINSLGTSCLFLVNYAHNRWWRFWPGPCKEFALTTILLALKAVTAPFDRVLYEVGMIGLIRLVCLLQIGAPEGWPKFCAVRCLHHLAGCKSYGHLFKAVWFAGMHHRGECSWWLKFSDRLAASVRCKAWIFLQQTSWNKKLQRHRRLWNAETL